MGSHVNGDDEDGHVISNDDDGDYSDDGNYSDDGDSDDFGDSDDSSEEMDVEVDDNADMLDINMEQKTRIGGGYQLHGFDGTHLWT